MSTTILTKSRTRDGEVMVLTKTRFYFLFALPRTSAMPWRVGELREKGVQFHWTTKEPDDLERLHNLVAQTLQELTLSELRAVAELGQQLLSLGCPFVPDDAPLPDSLKQLSNYVKRVI